MELYKASQQWKTRPADERYWTVPDMLAACKHYHETAAEASVPYDQLRVETINEDIKLVGKTGVPATLTHWSFGQMCQRVGAPAGYIRELPATLAAQNINHGLKVQAAKRENNDSVSLLFHANDNLVLRSLNSDAYTRVWNDEIIARLLRVLPEGWRVPPARPSGQRGEQTRLATADDVFPGTRVNVGDTIAPAGLYASDHDMFVFLVNPGCEIDAGNGQSLSRGVMVWNSEVGASSFGLCTFLYDAVCGNHIVWGAREVSEIRVTHIGRAGYKAFGAIHMELVKYANASVSDTEAQIASARTYELGTTKDEVIDKLLSFAAKAKTQGLTRDRLEAAYDVADDAGRYGSPRTVWGMVSGLTELSQKTQYADERVRLDRLAGKVMKIAF